MAERAGDMLYEQARRLFGDLASRSSGTDQIWAAIAAAGFHLALLPEAAGGFGVSAPEAFSVLRAAGETALASPLAETMLAIGLLGRTGLSFPDGPLTVGPVVGPPPKFVREGTGWRIQATLRRIPWGRNVAEMALLGMAGGKSMIARAPSSAWKVREETNIAGEPRDTLEIDVALPAEAVAPSAFDANGLRALGAAARCQLIAGALTRIRDMTVAYAGERVQFGKPIGRFQAVQQNLAVLASQAAAASAAADMAAEAIEPELRPLAIAAAKSRAGEAAGLGAAIAHQVHGAIGFTEEHKLHLFTRRLWSWRDEFGDETEWNLLLGRHLAAAGADRLWPELVAL